MGQEDRVKRAVHYAAVAESDECACYRRYAEDTCPCDCRHETEGSHR